MKSTIPLVKVSMPNRAVLLPALEEVLYSGIIAEGEYVYRFEEEFGKRFGLRNLVATSSGTAALHIALRLGGVSDGDEVISTSMTAEPTNTAILQSGAKVVFADIDPETGNLDPKSVEKCINKRTKAICVVHYAGYPADIQSLRKIADDQGLWLIEDCAHALGASYSGEPIGSYGDAAIFSFQAIKHITTIDGGMLVLRNGKSIELAKRTRWFGMSKGIPRIELDISELGYKYNMHNVAAVIGLAQLQIAGSNIESHHKNGRFFDIEFAKIPGLTPGKTLANAYPSYWIYTLLTEECAGVERRLKEIGVSASKLHRPNHLHTIFNQPGISLPGVEQFYKRLVHIPCGWWVTLEDRLNIVDALRKG
jgi:dTDP-4-amino-4,6-dideoxygalactose transaminase